MGNYHARFLGEITTKLLPNPIPTEGIMNIWILSSGLLGVFTALIHVFAGQLDPVRPFLKSDLEDIPKATFLACWHLVSVTLLSSSLMLTYVGWYGLYEFYLSTLLMGILYVFFALVFIVVGWYFFGSKVFVKLPQWILLLSIGLLANYGAITERIILDP
jgi:hypothetical protein